MRCLLWAPADAGAIFLSATAQAQEVETVVVTAKTLPLETVTQMDRPAPAEVRRRALAAPISSS